MENKNLQNLRKQISLNSYLLDVVNSKEEYEMLLKEQKDFSLQLLITERGSA